MVERTTHATVTFVYPFSLADLDGTQPAGTYRIEAVDATLDGLTFLAYRRISTTIELPAIGGGGPQRQLIAIDPLELQAAMAADAARVGQGAASRTNPSRSSI